MMADGLIVGVGIAMALSFFLMGVFIVVGFLEDVGYLPRLAYVFDLFMHGIGLHGKSFMPFLMGFCCNLSIDVRDWVRKTENLPFVRFIAVDNTISLRSLSLPGDFHPDPADRIITATALTIAAPLVTKDEKIRNYPHVKTIWE